MQVQREASPSISLGMDSDHDEYAEWMRVFESIVQLLDDYEQYRHNTANVSARENIAIRMESVVVLLQQVIACTSPGNLECFSFIEEILRNIRVLLLDWNATEDPPSHCTRLAIYSYQSPRVTPSSSPGRPKLDISEDVLLQLRSFGFTWKNISEMLRVSRWTIRRRVVEFGIEKTTGFSDISDEELDDLIREFILRHGCLVGCSIVSGHVKSVGLRIQRDRIRKSIARVDPTNSHIRWAVTVSRRTYSVPGPNSLWHIDGHHGLVNWGFVIHGAIDGFSRLIVFLKCSTNNKSETVKQCFLAATEHFEWPSRVRTDHGGENVKVWELMEERRGTNRGSYLAGTSVHNQRIERLWRDVFCAVCHIFYYTFQSMEECGALQRTNKLHMYVLHFIYLPRINNALNSFASAWNQHPIRTEHNWTPLQIWTNGMLDMRNHALCGISGVADSNIREVEDLEWYGFDPYAPRPHDDGLSTVELDDVDIDNEDDVITILRNSIDPLAVSNSFGIDLYMKALSLFTT